jgi:hypothetical protein
MPALLAHGSAASSALLALLVIAACGGRTGYAGSTGGATAGSGGEAGVTSGTVVGATGATSSGATVAVTGTDTGGTVSGAGPSGSVTSGTSGSPMSGAASGIATSSGTDAGTGTIAITPDVDAGPDGASLGAVPSAGCGKPWTGVTGKWVAQPTGCPPSPTGIPNLNQGTSACQVIPPGGVVPATATSGSPEYRGWWVYVPTGYDASKPYTVIYNGAGAFDSNWFHAGADGYPYQDVDKGQAILVGLDYDTYSWLLGAYDNEHANSNDFTFMPWLMDEIENTFCVDKGREWMSGYAEGATLAQQFDCALPSRLRGEVMVSGWEPGGPNDPNGAAYPNALPPCNPAPTAAFFVHDILDADDPYDSILPGCSRILSQNGCTNTKCDPSDPTLTTPYSVAAIAGTPPQGVDLSAANATCVEFSGCPAEHPVVFCTTNYAPSHHADGQQFGVVKLFWDFISRLSPRGPCPSEQSWCGGFCVNEQTDPHNCGSCGAQCPNALDPYGTLCVSGACACPNSCLFPDGTTHCVDEQTDPNFCGSCFLSCPTAAPFCRRGQCTSN